MAQQADHALPAVSVVICHHAGRLLEGCLETLKTSQGVTYEIIVITSDASYDTPRTDIHLVRAQGGPAQKRNLGTLIAKHPIVIYIDDDAEVSPYTLYNFWRGFQVHPEAGMLFARIYNGERRDELDDCGSWLTPTGFLYARASRLRLPDAELLRPTRCLASKSAGCAIRRATFYNVGQFDPTYFILGEETDLAWRVWLRGQEVWYWPDAVLWHYFNTSKKPTQDYYSLTRIHRYGARNYVNCLLTNLGALRLWAILPGHVLAWLLAALGFLARGQSTRGALVLQGLWDALIGLPSTWDKRRHVQGTRRVTDRWLLHPDRAGHRPPLSYYPRRLVQYIWNGLHG